MTTSEFNDDESQEI